MDQELYIGLMSGTSADGIDAALVDLSGQQPKLLATLEHPLPEHARALVSELALNGDNEIEKIASLDISLAESFADASLHLLKQANKTPSQIRAIGSHGQTIRHQPPTQTQRGYTLQIGDPSTLAEITGIDVIADFRRRDMAAGGHGAPLAPAFHRAVFSADKPRAIINIGGMANITALHMDNNPVIGFDTGAGNVLMDSWIQHCKGFHYDKDGKWASSGHADQTLLSKLLQHPFIKQAAPKSTGREAFNLPWLLTQIDGLTLNPEDIQATLLEFTSTTISDQIKQQFNLDKPEVYICGGGAHNPALVTSIAEKLPNSTVATTDALGVSPDWVEAMTFAWLAQQTLKRQNGNLSSVTGASGERVLGGIYPA